MVKKNRTNKKVSKKGYDSRVAKWVILIVIGLAMLAVVIALVCSIVFEDEKVVKAKMDNLAKTYYEEFIYDGIKNASANEDEVAKKMDRYVESGFAPVNLRQLMLYKRERTKKDADYIRRYCDENKTSVKFYPEKPYGKEDYRVEFRYSCEF